MLAQMTSQQAIEWEEMFNIWKIGDSPHYRDDLSAGIVASTMFNVNRTRGKAMKPDDFIPVFKSDQAAEQTPDALHESMMALARRRQQPRAPKRDNKAAPTKD